RRDVRSAALPASFYARPTPEVARGLLGQVLLSELGGRRTAGRIVETEAYLGTNDPASHGYGARRTRRNASLFERPGTAYVYFTYGMHWCLNAVTERAGLPAAVLIRALEPLEGLATMRRRRGGRGIPDRELCSGPAKLCQALGVTGRHDGLPLTRGKLRIVRNESRQHHAISVTPRIGITRAADWPLRFLIEDLDSLHRLGVRYMTLTWNNGNDWAGSSTDPKQHGGLSSFGRQVVARMNRLGMLVDVSHVSDATFWDVVATSTRPVIASHSSCRALAHHPRNLSDDELRAIARNGGVVGINFYPVFLDEHFRDQYEELRRRLKPQTDSIRARHRGRPGESAFEVDKFVGQHAESLDVPTIDRLL